MIFTIRVKTVIIDLRELLKTLEINKVNFSLFPRFLELMNDSRLAYIPRLIVFTSLLVSLEIYTRYMDYYYYGARGLCWTFAAFSVSWSYTQSVGLLGRGISPSQGLYLYTEQHKHKINTHNTGIHASSGIRTHDPILYWNTSYASMEIRIQAVVFISFVIRTCISCSLGSESCFRVKDLEHDFTELVSMDIF
jgi:hypothetical protein